MYKATISISDENGIIYTVSEYCDSIPNNIISESRFSLLRLINPIPNIPNGNEKFSG